MKINEILLSSYMIKHLTKEDEKFYKDFKEVEGLDMSDSKKLEKLLEWLRKLGCRNFHLKSNATSKNNLSLWYRENLEILKKFPQDLFGDNIKNNKDKITTLFSSLETKKVVDNTQNGISVGPTAASKILFVLKPNYFAMWDANIRAKFGNKGNDGENYYNYLVRIQRNLHELSKECTNYSTSIKDILKKTDRNYSFFPKLIEEYYFLKYTQGIDTKDLINILN